MSDLIRQLAEERRRRYQSLSAEEKPQVAVCPDCGEATYLKEVCPRSGLFHNMDKKKLIGGSIVDGNSIGSSALMGAIDRTRVKWAPSRTRLVKADAQSLNIFQSFAARMEWNLQRYGILYGRYLDGDGDNVIEVHAVYEPEQHGNRYAFEVVEDKRIDVVDKIAAGLGLRRVGVICTHPPRDTDTILLSSREMLLCAREQSRFGDECVLLTVSPSTVEDATGSAGSNRDCVSNTSPTSNASPQMVVQCQAWQVSPQCVYLYRLGVLHEPSAETRAAAASEAAALRAAHTTGPRNGGGGHASGRVEEQPTAHTPTPLASDAAGATRTPPTSPPGQSPPMSVPEEARLVESTLDLAVTQQDTDGSGRQRFVTQAPSRLIDTRWFTSYIAVQHFESTVVRGLFMRISRPGMAPPTFQNLRNYMTDPKRKNDTFAEKIADFHVLIFLAEVFSAGDDMPALVEIAKSKKMTEEARNYEAILEEYMRP